MVICLNIRWPYTVKWGFHKNNKPDEKVVTRYQVLKDKLSGILSNLFHPIRIGLTLYGEIGALSNRFHSIRPIGLTSYGENEHLTPQR